MLRPWLGESIKNAVYGLKRDVASSLGTLTQILSFDENEATILLHDGEYLIYGILDDKTRKDLTRVAKETNKNLSRSFAFFSEESFPAGMGKIFIVRYKENIIGGSVCLFSDDTAYLMFSAGMRKSYPLLYPGVLAVWEAMTYAREHGYSHFEFIDAGLPFKKYGYRDFILRFGGKQLSTRRWYRLKWGWLNRIMEKIYV